MLSSLLSDVSVSIVKRLLIVCRPPVSALGTGGVISFFGCYSLSRRCILVGILEPLN